MKGIVMKELELALTSVIENYEQYPMLKLAKDIWVKYEDKITGITPRYHHWKSTKDNKYALIGYHVEFSNKLTLSVFFGYGSYSPNRDSNLNPDNQMSYLAKASSAEIAILNKDGLLYFDDWNDSVLGYQSPDEIMQIIDSKINP